MGSGFLVFCWFFFRDYLLEREDTNGGKGEAVEMWETLIC